jgi:hypothetical protein
MANYYRNDLYIRGSEDELRRFRDDALPREGEIGERSRGGHAGGPLSFLSVLPPPPGVDARATGGVTNSGWGCLWPFTDDCALEGDCLNYYFSTAHAPAHDFTVSVSKDYPGLAFTLVWNDVHSGLYRPMEFAMFAVRAGRILVDYVEMRWETVLSLQPELPTLNRLNARARRLTEMRIAGMARMRREAEMTDSSVDMDWERFGPSAIPGQTTEAMGAGEAPQSGGPQTTRKETWE